jgi:hypothetical protein
MKLSMHIMAPVRPSQRPSYILTIRIINITASQIAEAKPLYFSNVWTNRHETWQIYHTIWGHLSGILHKSLASANISIAAYLTKPVLTYSHAHLPVVSLTKPNQTYSHAHLPVVSLTKPNLTYSHAHLPMVLSVLIDGALATTLPF